MHQPPIHFPDADSLVDRRGFFSWVKTGIGGAALASLLLRDAALPAAPLPGEAADAPPHHPAKAQRAIHICLCGALSHVDSFDYKPALAKYHGKPMPSEEKPDVFFGQVGLLRKNDWDFKQRGQSGLWISDLFPAIGEVADELTVINSMVADTSNHTPATFQENTGFRLNGFPVLGSWLSYGLGAETDELPSFVVIPDARGLPAGGTINWTNGFLPARHQGVVFRGKGPAIDDLAPAQSIDGSRERATRELLQAMNRRHIDQRGADDALVARVRSYELAAKMQLAVPQVTDARRRNGGHARAVRTRSAGQRPILAAAACWRGDCWSGACASCSFFPAARSAIRASTGTATRTCWPTTARKRRASIGPSPGCSAICGSGACSTTRWCCSPPSSAARRSRSRPPTWSAPGRDHNQYGFSVWMAGAGLRHGMAYGPTDDFGYKAVHKSVPWPDFHATVLHLLGIDHERLTFYHNGIQRRLTNVHGSLLGELLT